MADEKDYSTAALDAAQAAFNQSNSSVSQWSQPWTSEIIEFLTISLLTFAVISLSLSMILMWRSNATPHQILRVFGVLCIISVSALLLIVGYGNEQLTPIIGLFGAIAGYLLGKDSNTDKQ